MSVSVPLSKLDDLAELSTAAVATAYEELVTFEKGELPETRRATIAANMQSAAFMLHCTPAAGRC